MSCIFSWPSITNKRRVRKSILFIPSNRALQGGACSLPSDEVVRQLKVCRQGESFVDLLLSIKVCYLGVVVIWNISYLVWQLPTPNRLLSELHMGDLGCSNLRWKVLEGGKQKKMPTCLPLLMAISSDVGETLGSSEVPLPSSDSPSDPIRGCSCTTPRINRGVSFGCQNMYSMQLIL